MAFLIRPLNEQSIGATLRSLRKRQGISLDTVVEKTQIQRAHLESFEADAHHLLPDPLYARHFLRQFVDAIHGDVDYFLSRYDEECGSCSAITDELRIPRQRTKRRLLLKWRTWVKIVSLAVPVLLLLTYIGFQLHNLLAPPNLLIDTPADNIQITVATITVSGQTDQEVQVRVNDNAVLTDPTGRFETKITLTRGLNLVTIEAQKKYGKKQTVLRSVFLEDIGGSRTDTPSSPFTPSSTY